MRGQFGSRERTKEAIAGYLFLSPWIIGFIFITGGPILVTLILSFTQYDLVSAPRFVGLRNYVTMFTHDQLFWQSLKVTALYTVGLLPALLVISLLFAILLNRKLPGMSTMRTIYYLPSILPSVATTFVWAWVLNPDFGVFNSFIRGLLGVAGPRWLGSAQWVIPSFLMMSIWGSIGPTMVIFLAGMQGIPEQLYEAARVDGASNVRQFFSITLPMLSPVILFNLIMSLIGSFQVFTGTYLLTQGGPNYASYFYVFYLYKNAFTQFKMGYASALAWVMFLIILACTMVVLRSSSIWVYYQSDKSDKK